MIPAEIATSIDSGTARARVLAARDALITTHLHLVAPIARRIHRRLPPSFDLDDLISEGHIGLLQAAIRYRPDLHPNCQFETFAVRRIKGAIIDSSRRKKYIANTMLGHAPTAARGENPAGDLEQYISLPDKRSRAAFDQLEARIDLVRLFARAKMKPRYVRVTLAIASGRIMKAVGVDEGVNESRISQINKAALAKLREAA